MATPSEAKFSGCLVHHLVTWEPPPRQDDTRNPTSFTFVQDLVFVSEVCPSQEREQDGTLEEEEEEEESAIPPYPWCSSPDEHNKERKQTNQSNPRHGEKRNKMTTIL
jgi:hypothetical protein